MSNLTRLKRKITAEIRRVSQDILRNDWLNLEIRMRAATQELSYHIEQLYDEIKASRAELKCGTKQSPMLSLT